MSEVTREDVAEQLFYAARRDDWGVANDEEKAEFYDQADALIVAFPHLVGEVHDEQDDSGYGQYGQPIGPSRTIYTVTGPWREVER